MDTPELAEIHGINKISLASRENFVSATLASIAATSKPYDVQSRELAQEWVLILCTIHQPLVFLVLTFDRSLLHISSYAEPSFSPIFFQVIVQHEECDMGEAVQPSNAIPSWLTPCSCNANKYRRWPHLVLGLGELLYPSRRYDQGLSCFYLSLMPYLIPDKCSAALHISLPYIAIQVQTESMPTSFSQTFR